MVTVGATIVAVVPGVVGGRRGVVAPVAGAPETFHTPSASLFPNIWSHVLHVRATELAVVLGEDHDQLGQRVAAVTSTPPA